MIANMTIELAFILKRNVGSVSTIKSDAICEFGTVPTKKAFDSFSLFFLSLVCLAKKKLSRGWKKTVVSMLFNLSIRRMIYSAIFNGSTGRKVDDQLLKLHSIIVIIGSSGTFSIISSLFSFR